MFRCCQEYSFLADRAKVDGSERTATAVRIGFVAIRIVRSLPDGPSHARKSNPTGRRKDSGFDGTARRCGREAEGGGLLNRYRVVKPYRGFESLRLRQSCEMPMGSREFDRRTAWLVRRGGIAGKRSAATGGSLAAVAAHIRLFAARPAENGCRFLSALMRRSHKSGCASPVILRNAGVVISDMPDFGSMKYKAARRPRTRPCALGSVHLAPVHLERPR
jgi:hypothetical protein